MKVTRYTKGQKHQIIYNLFLRRNVNYIKRKGYDSTTFRDWKYLEVEYRKWMLERVENYENDETFFQDLGHFCFNINEETVENEHLLDGYVKELEDLYREVEGDKEAK